MILEFKDESKIEASDIFAGPKMINGVMRDVLRIEVPPTRHSFAQLKARFKNNPNTDVMYTYVNTTDEDGHSISEKVKIGEGYNIFVSLSIEDRIINPPPGTLAPPETEEIFVVSMAQETYDEHQISHPPQDTK